MISAFLIDDHDIIVDGIEAMLANSEEVKVTGKADNVDEAEKYISLEKPDIVITDISMPGKSGLELTSDIKGLYPGMKVIALSMYDDSGTISAMINAGASGYLLKTVKRDELLLAITRVYRGDTYIQQSLSKNFVSHLLVNDKQVEAPKQLSAREIEIIKLIAQDFTTADISKKLFLSAYTVETHRKNIWRKTGVKSIIALMKFAQENHLL